MERMDNNTYIPLKNLEVYQLARQLSVMVWKIYERLHWQDKKTMGDQFVTSADSVGANIAEGYGRYHYLDKIRFYYNSRGSLVENGIHWVELLYERDKITQKELEELKQITEKLGIKLNNFISATYKANLVEIKNVKNEFLSNFNQFPSVKKHLIWK